MKYLAAALVVLAMSTAAFAGGNPQVQMYISFDQTPPNTGWIHEYTATPYVAFDAYVCITCVELGFTTVSFMLSDPSVDCPGAFAPPSFTNLLPGNLAIGAWNTGITLASTECITSETAIAKLNLFPLGPGCCIQILDHPEYPRWVVDCNDPGLVDYYCVRAHGSINGAACPDGEGCHCDTPVEDATWGGIKALYR